jgi:hypothetical protein
VEKYCRTVQATDENMVRAFYFEHALRLYITSNTLSDYVLLRKRSHIIYYFEHALRLYITSNTLSDYVLLRTRSQIMYYFEHALRLCITYCISTATMVARRRLIITFTPTVPALLYFIT